MAAIRSEITATTAANSANYFSKLRVANWISNLSSVWVLLAFSKEREREREGGRERRKSRFSRINIVTTIGIIGFYSRGYIRLIYRTC